MPFHYSQEARDMAEACLRLDNDVNGNPRYYLPAYALPEVLKVNRKAAPGLSVYRGRRYGAGYVLQSYNLEYDCEKYLERARDMLGKAALGGFQWGPGFAPIPLGARPLAWLDSRFSGLVPCRVIGAARHAEALGLHLAVAYTGRAAPYAGRAPEAWPAAHVFPRSAARAGRRLIRAYDWTQEGLPELTPVAAR